MSVNISVTVKNLSSLLDCVCDRFCDCVCDSTQPSGVCQSVTRLVCDGDYASKGISPFIPSQPIFANFTQSICFYPNNLILILILLCIYYPLYICWGDAFDIMYDGFSLNLHTITKMFCSPFSEAADDEECSLIVREDAPFCQEWPCQQIGAASSEGHVMSGRHGASGH